MQKQDLDTCQKCFRDPVKILQDPHFLRYHLPPLQQQQAMQNTGYEILFKQ